MQDIHNRIDDNYSVDEETSVYGMINGDVTIAPNQTLHLHGMINGRVIVAKGAVLELYGIVNGNVYNQGGTVNKPGMLNGKLIDEKRP